jgi:hypothetical protein
MSGTKNGRGKGLVSFFQIRESGTKNGTSKSLIVAFSK